MAEWAECKACSTTAEPGSCETVEVAAGVTTGASITSPDSSGCESGVRRRVTSAVTVDTICSSIAGEMAELGPVDVVAKLTGATAGSVVVEAALLGLLVTSAVAAVADADERLLRGRREGG
ncbi:Hypothetical predicted protein [Paramuricea clavata]|uniref:Uncharacterized protein n=1 Tax=Paramuricea clavata TaxID=317549 RepID=A0A6S7LAE9_PARCT|nr:Hypothetical predicted protein [Paramuricea clavata]